MRVSVVEAFEGPAGFLLALAEPWRSRASGILEVRREGVTTLLYLDEGEPVFAESSALAETLGRVLLLEGALTEAQYAAVVHRMTESIVEAEPMRFGEVAVALGFVHPMTIQEALSSQVRRRLLTCLAPGPQLRHWLPDTSIVDDVGSFPQDVPRLLAEGVASLTDEEREAIFVMLGRPSVGGQDPDPVAYYGLPPSDARAWRRREELPPDHELLFRLAILDGLTERRSAEAPVLDRAGWLASERAAAERLAAERDAVERGAERAEAERAEAQRLETERAATRMRAERAATERAATERAATERAATERAATERAATERAATERAATERAATERAATETDREGPRRRPTPPRAQDPAARAEAERERARLRAKVLAQRARPMPAPATSPEPAPSAAKRPSVIAQRKRLLAETALRNGRTHLAAGRFEPAARDFERACELESDPEMALHLTFVRWKLGDASLGEPLERDAKALLRREPQNGFAPYVLAHRMLEQGDEEKALKSFRRAAQMDPTLRDAERHARLLASRLKK